MKNWLDTCIRALVAGAAFGIGLGGVSLARAEIQKVWVAGELLKAGDLNETFAALDTRLASAEDLLSGAVPEAEHALTADAAAGAFTVPDDLEVTGNASVAGVLGVGLYQSTACTFNVAAAIPTAAVPPGRSQSVVPAFRSPGTWTRARIPAALRRRAAFGGLAVRTQAASASNAPLPARSAPGSAPD